ncbi:prevent-host-death protein [Catenibacterium mitsuokai]|nr:prevent-host-death protein [Catenibacterium mitsuokai]
MLIITYYGVNLCRDSQEPIYLIRNGEGDLAVMDIETFSRREKLLDLREQLLFVEEERVAGSKEYTIDELDKILDEVIQGYRKY